MAILRKFWSHMLCINGQGVCPSCMLVYTKSRDQEVRKTRSGDQASFKGRIKQSILMIKILDCRCRRKYRAHTWCTWSSDYTLSIMVLHSNNVTLTSPTMNLGYCSNVSRFSLSSLSVGGSPQLLQMASRESNTWVRECVFSGPQQVVNAAARTQFAISVSGEGSDWSFVCHDSCLAFKLRGWGNVGTVSKYWNHQY